MSSIYLNKTRESWVVDRFRDEWYENNADISTKYKVNADLIWLIAPWTWRKVNLRRLKKTKVKITKLAQGLPVGGEIESLDDGTLFSAFKNRANLNSNSD